MTRLGALVLAVATLIAGCSTAPTPSGNLPGASPPGPDTSAPGRLVHVDDVKLSNDGMTLTLPFVGAPEYEPTNPCAMEYAASADLNGEVLEIAVTERPSRFALPPPALPPPAMFACNSIGFLRELSIEVEAPFAGSTVRDRSGYTFFVAPPDGLVSLAGLPDGWTLVLEEDLPESPTGRWQRSHSNLDQLPRQSSPGRIDLIQAFGGPVNVSGGEELTPVDVNTRGAQLWRWAPTGELVLVWQLEGTGLALVANEADLSVDELVELAESAELPN